MASEMFAGRQDIMDKLIRRARVLVAFMSEVDAASMLMDTGVDAGDAFLAVKAATVLNGEI